MPGGEQEPEQQPAEHRLVEERRRDRVDDRARVRARPAGTGPCGSGRGRCRWRSPCRSRRRRGPGSPPRGGRRGPRNRSPAGFGWIHEHGEDPADARACTRRAAGSSDGLRPQRSTSSYSAALKRSASNRRITSSSASPSDHQDPQRVRDVVEIPGRSGRSHVRHRARRQRGADGAHHASPMRRIARNASCGISTDPTRFIRCFPSFCFSSSLRLRVMSPP